MRTLRTENSTYEIDETNKLIRRRDGLNAPTERQGKDGEWKEYLAISIHPAGLIIQWGWNDDGTAKCTFTSKVVEDNYGV